MTVKLSELPAMEMGGQRPWWALSDDEMWRWVGGPLVLHYEFVWCMHNNALGAKEAVLLSVIDKIAIRLGVCDASLVYIAKHTGFTYQYVVAAVARMVAKGYLRRVRVDFYMGGPCRGLLTVWEDAAGFATAEEYDYEYEE